MIENKKDKESDKNRNYNVLIVDDEQLARTLLEEYVSKVPSLHLLASCSNAMEAQQHIRQQSVDILLSDIEMPDISGVEFVKSLSYKPSIIFTTAYSQYAIDGYDLGVVDYLLKPIAFPRFFNAIDKAIARIQLLENNAVAEAQPAAQSNPVAESLRYERNYLMVKADRRFYKINFSDLIYVEGQQEYVTFHTVQRNITAYYALKNLVSDLPADQFVRIHKSYIVSVKYIQFVDTNTLTIANEELPVGPTYRDALWHSLNHC